MTRLNLKPGSPELSKIMSNKFLFTWYAKMLMEDYELEMNRYKYVAMYSNPELFQKIEQVKDAKYTTANTMAKNGMVDKYKAKALNDEINMKLGIIPKKDDGIDII